MSSTVRLFPAEQPEAGARGNRGQGLFVARIYMAKIGGTISARNVEDGVKLPADVAAGAEQAGTVVTGEHAESAHRRQVTHQIAYHLLDIHSMGTTPGASTMVSA